jgi:hypothetical protein
MTIAIAVKKTSLKYMVNHLVLCGDREMHNDTKRENNYFFHAKDNYVTNLKKDQRKTMRHFFNGVPSLKRYSERQGCVQSISVRETVTVMG